MRVVMNIQLPGLTLMATLVLLLAPAAQAATDCVAGYQQINNNNSILMLGGTARGPVKQFVLGEFGKDVDQQKRMIGEFDRCGVLQHADIRFDKQEGSFQVRVVQSIEHVYDGWLSSYTISVTDQRNGKETVINDKQGTTHYRTDRRGRIVSATDTFTLKGEDGFTETTHFFDRQSRLIRSVARGTDPSTNGVSVYRWNNKNHLLALDTDGQKMTWAYDKDERELVMNIRSDTPMNSMTNQIECQLWDDEGNCTLSYSREMEVYPGGIIRRNITAAYRYEYWE